MLETLEKYLGRVYNYHQSNMATSSGSTRQKLATLLNILEST